MQIVLKTCSPCAVSDERSGPANSGATAVLVLAAPPPPPHAPIANAIEATAKRDLMSLPPDAPNPQGGRAFHRRRASHHAPRANTRPLARSGVPARWLRNRE